MKITDETEYKAAFVQLDAMIAEGFEDDSKKKEKFRQLALDIEAYEDSIPLMPIPVPGSLEEMIRLKMYQRKVNQKQLAQLLEITETRLSEVLRGKRNINFDMARRLHQKLGIDGNFILEKA